MSVKPISFNPDGSITCDFDETNHLGNLTLADVSFGVYSDGSVNFRIVNIPCPDKCGAGSSHPIVEGIATNVIQELFVRYVNKNGCPCGNLLPNKPMVLAVAHAKLHVGNLNWRAGVIK